MTRRQKPGITLNKRAAVRHSHSPRLSPEHPHHVATVPEQHKHTPAESVTELGETFVENENRASDLAEETLPEGPGGEMERAPVHSN